MQDTEVMIAIGGRWWCFPAHGSTEIRGKRSGVVMANCGCTIALRTWSRVANSARLRSSNYARETLLADVFGAWGCEAAIRGRLGRGHDQEMRSSSGWSRSMEYSENYQRLCARYPEIMRQFGFSEWSAY
jgi:hypothetical protein